MSADDKVDDLLTRYLLGDVSDEAREALEEKYFRDRELFERLSAVEETLVDSYLRGDLRARDLQQFEERYLSTQKGRERIRASAAFREGINKRTTLARTTVGQPQSLLARLVSLFRIRSVALVTATAVALFGIIFWLSYSNRETRPDAPAQASLQEESGGKKTVDAQSAAQTEQAGANRDAQAAESNSNSLTADGNKAQQQRNDSPAKNERRTLAAAFVLRPGLTRSAGATREIVVPARATEVTLRLLFDDDEHQSYRAIIRTAEGVEVWRREGLRARTSKAGRSVSVALPARDVVAGDYILLLSGRASGDGFESVSEYYFRVAAQKR